VDEVYRQSHSRTSTTSACRPLVRSTDQLYDGIHTTDRKHPSAYAKTLAEQLAAETPHQVVTKMARDLRRERVFIDWSQNNPAKTTIAPYSLRGRTQPTVSTPITWDEVRACRNPSSSSSPPTTYSTASNNSAICSPASPIRVPNSQSGEDPWLQSRCFAAS
jgi:hypothetical protein